MDDGDRRRNSFFKVVRIQLRHSGVTIRDYWTITLARSIFITQVNAMSPACPGANSITTGSWSGSDFLIVNEGNTTSVPQVLSVVRTNVSRAGTPARSVTFAGS